MAALWQQLCDAVFHGPAGGLFLWPSASFTSPLPPSSVPLSFDRLDHYVLQLVLQYLPWRDLLLHASHLSRAVHVAAPAVPHCEHLTLDESWELQQRVRAARRAGPPSLFSHVQRLSLISRQRPLSSSLLSVLRPPSPLAPSPFSQLRHLQLLSQPDDDAVVRRLEYGHSGWPPLSRATTEAALLERIIASAATFPFLDELRVRVRRDERGRELSACNRKTLGPLTRLPSLRCLQLEQKLSVNGFCLLCSLPLTTLRLKGCSMRSSHGAALIAPVTTTWEIVEFPNPTLWSDLALYASICRTALAGYADSCEAAAAAGAVDLPRLQRLSGGWSVGVLCTAAVARIPSLMELTSHGTLKCTDDTALDVSPLFSADLQPLLSRLHTVHFPDLDICRLSDDATAALVDSSVAFLTAYSQQLRVLTLRVYSRPSTGRLLEAALQCSQLTELTLCSRDRRADESIDVEQLSPAVAFLPPLRHLMSLQLLNVHLSERALAQLLDLCPEVTRRPSEFAYALPRHAGG